MRFTWEFQEDEEQLVRTFLRSKGISRGLLAKIKFQQGEIRVNGTIQNVLYSLKQGDCVTIRIPDEGEHETMIGEATPIDIVFEDEHFLVVNKPTNVASIPAQYHPNGTMANRVKGYYQGQGYVNQIVHIVTRLDRDTTGLMLFAKHGYAHAMMDKQLREGSLVKRYQALVTDTHRRLLTEERIDLPILRDEQSIIKRKVGEGGLHALTEYRLIQQQRDVSLVAIRLHTGRTHQIRVHFSAIGCPLVGDELYGGDMSLGLTRQALHCAALQFRHPFTEEIIYLEQKLPEDMLGLI